MTTLPGKTNTTIFKIYEHYEKNNAGRNRPHLGASEIGKKCSRSLFYSFRWALKPQFEGRILRLFETGQREEPRLIENLQAIGVQVHECDPETGKQFSVSEFGRHFAGSLDGACINLPEAPKTWHVLEFKTHGQKSFDALRKGVEKAKPEHFAQMQIYMGLTGMTRAAYVAVNKNTDEIYFERINYDAKVFKELIKKAENIIFADTPPEKISENSDSWDCRYCNFKNLCHQESPELDKAILPEMNCRTCLHSTAKKDGTWQCVKHDCILSIDKQKTGCENHLFIPQLLPWPQIDATQIDVTYQNIKGEEIYNHEDGLIDQIPF